MDLSLGALKEAVEIRQQIDDLEERLFALFNEPAQTQAATVARPRQMSAAAKARLSVAAKARWARARGEQPTTPQRPEGRQSGITSAGRKRLSEMMKARWAAKKRRSGGR